MVWLELECAHLSANELRLASPADLASDPLGKVQGTGFWVFTATGCSWVSARQQASPTGSVRPATRHDATEQCSSEQKQARRKEHFLVCNSLWGCGELVEVVSWRLGD